ncbi:MAG: cyclic nucleotide-binding domain-containing protein, partial [Mucilaginibacter sp.]
TEIVYIGIAKALNRICSFSAAEVEMVVEATSSRTVKKRDTILSKGQVCNFIVIIISGSLRLVHEADEKEHTLNFFSEYDFAADHESFVSQKPSVNTIEALEDSVISVISIHQLHALIGRNQAFFAIGRVMENWTKATTLTTHFDKPKQRFEKLMELRPDWILRFSQIHLASYLGMAPETFSRMKRKSLFS